MAFTKAGIRSTLQVTSGFSIGCGIGIFVAHLPDFPIVPLSAAVLSALVGLSGLVRKTEVLQDSFAVGISTKFKLSGLYTHPLTFMGAILGLAVQVIPDFMMWFPKSGIFLWQITTVTLGAATGMLLYLSEPRRRRAPFEFDDDEDREYVGLIAHPQTPSPDLGKAGEGQGVVVVDELRIMRDSLRETKARLAREISGLSKRGNLNLVIGIFTTLLSAAFLAYFVLTSELDLSDLPHILKYYIPRISFVVFTEIFSFFFLKLYKSSLDGIKYFQNELTNVELRFISIELALLQKSNEQINSLVSTLGNTERNFVLKSGESTVELRRAELDRENYKEILTSLSAIVGRINKT